MNGKEGAPRRLPQKLLLCRLETWQYEALVWCGPSNWLFAASRGISTMSADFERIHGRLKAPVTSLD